MSSELKPILKWAGGKSSLLPKIKECIVNHSTKLVFKRYVEPFLGSGALFLSLIQDDNFQIKNFLINDANMELMNLYRCIKKNPREVISRHMKIKNEYLSTCDYYLIRSKFNGIDQNGDKIKKYSKLDRAAAFMILNKTCFNGLYRVNKQGLFNVPKGRYKTPSFVSDKLIKNLSKILPDVNHITSRFYYEISYQKNDLIYFDPPYTPISKTSNFTDYSSSTFGDEEQIKLAKKFDELDKSGKHVILSNSKTKFIKDLYSKFKNKYTVNRSGNINSKKDKRGKVEEYIILGNNFGK